MSFAATNLSTHLSAWKDIGASETVLDWVEHGVPIPFTNEPPQIFRRNPACSETQRAFIDAELAALVKSGVLLATDSAPHCVSPIHCVPRKSGKKFRLIVDLREVNSCCKVDRFQNEDIKVVKQLIQPCDRLVTVDLKDCFYHVKVRPEHQTFLGICWRSMFYVFTSLPFGLSCSPYYCGKIIRPVIQHLRQLGLRVTVFVDDFLLMVHETQAQEHKHALLRCLQSVGWTINWEKSHLVPELTKLYIGYILDTCGEFPTIRIPAIRQVKKTITRAIDRGSLTARHLARITGQCVSMVAAVVPGKLFLRNAYRLLAQRTTWQDILHLDQGTVSDLQWWLTAVDGWNCHQIRVQPVDIQIETDASSVAWGAVCGQHQAAGHWNARVSEESSNYRELLAILLAIQAFAPLLRGKHVQILTDNVTAAAYLNKLGGQSADLTQVAKAIWSEAYSLQAHLSGKHLAGVLNVDADRLSRLDGPYDWTLNPRVFEYLDRVWGPHTIDRFAAFDNTQLPEYNSYYHDPATSGIDALAQQDWGAHHNWVNPPFRLIPRILQVIRQQGATATLIAPYWPAQPWFQTLVSMTREPPIRLSNHRGLFVKTGVCPEPCRNRRWKIFAWSISGS